MLQRNKRAREVGEDILREGMLRVEEIEEKIDMREWMLDGLYNLLDCGSIRRHKIQHLMISIVVALVAIILAALVWLITSLNKFNDHRDDLLP